ncbi:uncharacterized protein LOC134285278 [Aedes albopictus]|uniref:Secreted protein n=1 Tax=Aedes albopictus TaxID=7160 RepID=A0ABM1XYV5_AEDAL
MTAVIHPAHAAKAEKKRAKFVELLITHGKVLLQKSQGPPEKYKKKDTGKEICVQMIVQHGSSPNRQNDHIQNNTKKTILEEQPQLIQAQQAYTVRQQAQQDKRHEKEMELLVLKKKLTLLEIQQLENEEQ